MLKLFAVYDEKAEAYGSIICCSTRGLALRSFSDACADPNSPMAKSPSDFKLCELGFYDPNTGLVEGIKQPLLVATAAQVLSSFRTPSPVSEAPVAVNQ